MPSARFASAHTPIAFALVAVVAIVVFIVPSAYAGLLTVIGLYSLITLGLNVFMGYTGQVSLGQAAFYGIGAYAAALLSTRLGISPWFAMLAGASAAATVAYALSFVVLRLRENLLALGTLALGIVVAVIFANWEFVGGTSGIKGIPGFAIGRFTFDVRAYAIFAWLLVACAMFFVANIVRSSYGRALVAIAAGELGAQTLGVSGERLKRQIFVLSAALAGIAGAVYASYVSYIDPSSFGFLLSVQLVLMSVIGGLRTLWGAIVGATVVVGLSHILQSAIPALIAQVQKIVPWFPSAHGDFESFFFGVLLIAMLILVPRGIMGRAESGAVAGVRA